MTSQSDCQLQNSLTNGHGYVAQESRKLQNSNNTIVGNLSHFHWTATKAPVTMAASAGNICRSYAPCMHHAYSILSMHWGYQFGLAVRVDLAILSGTWNENTINAIMRIRWGEHYEDTSFAALEQSHEDLTVAKELSQTRFSTVTDQDETTQMLSGHDGHRDNIIYMYMLNIYIWKCNDGHAICVWQHGMSWQVASETAGCWSWWPERLPDSAELGLLYRRTRHFSSRRIWRFGKCSDGSMAMLGVPRPWQWSIQKSLLETPMANLSYLLRSYLKRHFEYSSQLFAYWIT